MKNKINDATQLRQKVLARVCENGGEIVYSDSSLIKVIFSEYEIGLAVRTYLEIVEMLNQKAELHGGTRLTVFLTQSDRQPSAPGRAGK
jgi:hypothetical protein